MRQIIKNFQPHATIQIELFVSTVDIECSIYIGQAFTSVEEYISILTFLKDNLKVNRCVNIPHRGLLLVPERIPRVTVDPMFLFMTAPDFSTGYVRMYPYIGDIIVECDIVNFHKNYRQVIEFIEELEKNYPLKFLGISKTEERVLSLQFALEAI